MPVQPKIYVEGQNQAADKLNQLYEQLSASPLAERSDDGGERSDKDPFGLKEERSDTSDRTVACEVAQRLTKFFALCVHDFRLSPDAAMFAAELTALNIFNAKDVPLTAEQIDAARKAAYTYYVESLPNIPEPARSR